MYELMLLMKATDDRLAKGIGTGEFLAIYWPHRGQEAIAAALGAVLRDSDQLVTTYRGLHDHIGKGVPVVDIFAELMGKDTAPGRGKGGTLHLAHPKSGVMLSTGIVGAGIPVGVGLALAAQYRGLDRVTAVCFGDGATNTGSFHEAVNMAALWNLPAVFICQNNLYAEMTPVEMTMKVERIADRALGYDIPGVRVDGNDPDALYDVLTDAVGRARSGGGPSLVEAVTFRFRGHSFGDPMQYIPKEQMAEAELRDPIPVYRERLVAAGVCTEDDLEAIEAAAVSAVDDAATEAMGAAKPSADALLDDVYANPEKMPA
jgi:pyruvate dehydrogenase E1 component alpha subunit